MTLCPNTKGGQCHCQPQDGLMCPHGPTPSDWTPWVPEPAIQQCHDCNGYGRVNDGSGARSPYGPKCPKCGGSGSVAAAGVNAVTQATADLEEMRQHGNADDVMEAAAHLERTKHESGVAPTVATKDDFPYDRTFQAIAAASKSQVKGVAVEVSVKAFIEAWNAYPTRGVKVCPVRGIDCATVHPTNQCPGCPDGVSVPDASIPDRNPK